jgi:WD40 repeat protein
VEPKHAFEAHDGYVLSLCYSHDGSILVTAGMDRLIKLWSTADWSLRVTLEGHQNSVNCLALAPDEHILASGSSDNTVRLWSFPGGRPLQTLPDRRKTVAGLAIAPDGRWLAAASYGGRVMVWTIAGEPLVGIKASAKNITSVAFSSGSTVLATAGLGDDIGLWSLPSGDSIGSLSGHKTAVTSLCFIEDGRRLVSLGYEGAVLFWDTDSWLPVRTEQAPPTTRSLLVSPDERWVALALEGRAQIRDLAGWSVVGEYPIGGKAVSSMAFSPDCRTLLVGAADRRLRIWSLPGAG